MLYLMQAVTVKTRIHLVCTQRLEIFVKHWLYDTLEAEWHWFTYEYQGRCSIHCHGTIKLNNDQGLCKLTEIALKGFLAQKFKDENGCPDTTELDQDIEAGQTAADTVCHYVDWLLSTGSFLTSKKVADVSRKCVSAHAQECKKYAELAIF